VAYICNVKLFGPVPSNYSVSTDAKNWWNARIACKAKGMDLVSIETAKENTCVKEKIELAGL
jgi:hypothetical protein